MLLFLLAKQSSRRGPVCWNPSSVRWLHLTCRKGPFQSRVSIGGKCRTKGLAQLSGRCGEQLLLLASASHHFDQRDCNTLRLAMVTPDWQDPCTADHEHWQGEMNAVEMANWAAKVRCIPRPLSFLLPTSRRQRLPGGQRLVFADDILPSWVSNGNDVLAGTMFVQSDGWLHTTKGKTLGRSPIVAIWKPHGVTTTMAESEENSLSMLVRRIATALRWPLSRQPQPVGRLDKKTTGLLLLTDNGDLTKLLCAAGGVSKTYMATVHASRPSHEQLQRLVMGIDIGDSERGLAKAISAEFVGAMPAQLGPGCAGSDCSSHAKIRLMIAEGRYHVVKRILAAVGLHVLTLHREAIGGLSCAALGLHDPGSFAPVSANEVLELIGECGLLPRGPAVASALSSGSASVSDTHVAMRWRGRAVYNALRCGLLLCHLRSNSCVGEQEAARLRAWLQEHWTLEGPCMGTLRKLCPGLSVRCVCEAPDMHFFRN